MINSKKLLAAFIFSANSSGFCNPNVKEPIKKAQSALLEKFILNEHYFPDQEIEKTHVELKEKIKKHGTRKYIYQNHLEKIKNDLETISGIPFLEAIKNKLFLQKATNCSVNLYKVLELNENEITGKHLQRDIKKTLTILPGLEVPARGDIVSGHWGHYLEVMGDRMVPKYESIFESINNYFNDIRKK